MPPRRKRQRDDQEPCSVPATTDTVILKQIKVYFPDHSMPFIVPYVLNDERERSVGAQVQSSIGSIAQGIKDGLVDWFLVPALLPPDNVEIELIHRWSLDLLSDTLIKPDGAYLVFWTPDSWNVKELVKKGLELINSRSE
ncbi:uncharacterized protein LAJ45_04875 [Morchella importuna]|uniref:uncharacterized protein n=1 Tax=Morchella importuna TaxID=1174673 RepID=UPI001E8D861C|nr:uncharacterized protein LAJ45_04875 [Morchella importuna]KAH8151173.1 hypothetical protein LAJ45_04875 [Morchella importuna]